MIEKPIAFWLEKLWNEEPFTLSRFGDGEALCIFNDKFEHNIDGAKYTPEIKYHMKRIFEQPKNYYHSLLYCSFDHVREQWSEYLDKSGIEFYNGEWMQQMSLTGRIEDLNRAFSAYYKPVIVGGGHLQGISHIKGFEGVIISQGQEVNSFEKYNDMYNDVISLYDMGARMFLFTSGFTSKILIYNLFDKIGGDSWLIDVGSLYDPYCGRMSRRIYQYLGENYFKSKLKF